MVETEGPQLPPEAEKFLRQEYQKYVAQGGDLSYPEFKQLVLQQAAGEQGPEQEEIMASSRFGEIFKSFLSKTNDPKQSIKLR